MIRTSPSTPTTSSQEVRLGNDLAAQLLRCLSPRVSRALLVSQFPNVVLKRSSEHPGFGVTLTQSPIRLPRRNSQAQHSKHQHAAKRCHDHRKNEQDISRLEHGEDRSQSISTELHSPLIERPVPLEKTFADHIRSDGANGEKRPERQGIPHITLLGDDQGHAHDRAGKRREDERHEH